LIGGRRSGFGNMHVALSYLGGYGIAEE
jgi:hypothetical protein